MGTGIRDILRMVFFVVNVGNMVAYHNTVVVVGTVHYRRQPSVHPAVVAAYGRIPEAGSSGRNKGPGNKVVHIAVVPVDVEHGNVDDIWRARALRLRSSL